jgi:NAD(P)-dependent dehydrogenase (short-subunit alcohol dehydrogenase family)
MARIFISGSSTGLGLMAGQLLAGQGHDVVLHARNAARTKDTQRALPQAKAVVVADLETVAGAREAARQANAVGPFDAVIHNAAVGYQEPHRVTADGVPHVFAINTLAAYVLTASIERPKRLVYLSSGLHQGASANLDDILWRKRRWNGNAAYSESKLHDALLAFAVARLWRGVRSNAVEPGWVATRMGGPGATDDLDQGHRTQAWLAASEEPDATTTAGYFYHLKPREPNPQARDVALQDRLLDICREASGIGLPMS